MTRQRALGWLAVVVLVVAVEASRELLPTEGWGLAIRWVIGIALSAWAVLCIGYLLLDTVRAFRRGLTEEE